MTSLVDRIAPPRMGAGFRWLLSSSLVSNLGDGIALAAGPLLVASQTSNAFLVALAALLQRLPWLLLGLYAGALADRVDRRRLVVAANAARAVVLAVLAITIATGHVSVTVVLGAMLLLGVAEVFADTATNTLLPMLVRPDDLGIGNARFQGSFLVANHIVGPPIGAFLFAAGMAVPFVTQAVLVAFAVVLVGRISLPVHVREADERSHVLQEIREGLRWVWHHDAVRTLAVVIVAFNITWAAAWAVLVLYAIDHLGMGEVGFGLLTSAAAVGGLVSTSLYDRIERRFDLATVMRACLTLEVVTHLSFAVAPNGAWAMATMVVFGAYAFVWGAVSTAVRQRATPRALQGRVSSVYSVCVFGGLVVGQLLGGWIAETWGLTAPFWFAFVGAGITLALVWRQLAHIAHVEAAEQ
ncbi:MAG: MFS transporter [Candidatus Nanopelagicales bacterium]